MTRIRLLYKHGLDGKKHEEIYFLYTKEGEVHAMYVVNTMYCLLYTSDAADE